MSERWVGITVSGKEIVVVDAEVGSTGPIVINADHTWNLQRGGRPAAYDVIHQRLADYLTGHKVDRAVVKASAYSRSGTTLAHLEAAELRGAVLAAAASATRVDVIAMAVISKTFGTHEAEKYLKDDEFWGDEVSGKTLRKGSREAGLILLAVRKSDG